MRYSLPRLVFVSYLVVAHGAPSLFLAPRFKACCLVVTTLILLYCLVSFRGADDVEDAHASLITRKVYAFFSADRLEDKH